MGTERSAGVVDVVLSPAEERRIGDDETQLRTRVASRLGISPDVIAGVRVRRRSLDARKKRPLWRLEVAYWRDAADAPPPIERTMPPLPPPRAGCERVAIVGSGPAGLFAALTLTAAGIGVTLVERGKDVQARRHDLARITRGIAVDPDSNYCFGEGGAGTYSDGKLYTRSGSRTAIDEVLAILVAHGAPPRILADARPHIGSNLLPNVVAAIRRTLLEAGVDVRFGTRCVDVLVTSTRTLSGIRVRTGERDEEILAPRVLVATGHGARDMLAILARAGVRLEAKPFAMGVRIEHPQALIDHIQYGPGGREAGLPPAAYSATATVDGRGVYTFCMCPGGWIVPAMTEPGALVLNGMSLSRRDSPYANSGVVVAIEPGDLIGAAGRAWGVEWLGVASVEDEAQAPFAHGLEVQAALERRAWDAGGGGHRAPAARLVDFLARRASTDLPASSYHPGLVSVPLAEVLPPGIHDRLVTGLQAFTRRLPGYLHRDAVLAAVESRTSSPVRVPRDPVTLVAPDLAGLYPVGEGAGYAGGIVSAALDGIAAARACLAGMGLEMPHFPWRRS